MSVYHGKVLELLAIEKNNEKSYLRIKLSFEQEVELLWEIDGDTAENLMTISDFNGNHKYRLSLHTRLDINKKQYISFITNTYRDKSNRIYFPCSVEFKNNLDSITNIQTMDDLENLPFLTIIPKNEVVISTVTKRPLKWISVAMISVIFIILFGYMNNSYAKKKINDTAIANTKVKTADVKLDKKKYLVTPVTTIEKDDSIQSSLPYIKLEDSITYSLPEGYVSLTFDDGPSIYTEKIVDILKQYKVGGTFFFIGMNVKKHPDYVRYVQSNGFSIGNHSMNHMNMSDLPYEKQRDELMQSSEAIEDITNEEVVLFRPPFEALNEQTKNVIQDYQNKMILWNRDPKDWKTRDADKIFNYIHNTEASGSIIVFHESQAVINALPRIIEHLQEQNLNIVSLQ